MVWRIETKEVEMQLLTMLGTAVSQMDEIKFFCPLPLLQERNYWSKEAKYFMTIMDTNSGVD